MEATHIHNEIKGVLDSWSLYRSEQKGVDLGFWWGREEPTGYGRLGRKVYIKQGWYYYADSASQVTATCGNLCERQVSNP
jgi:hypothetical protein